MTAPEPRPSAERTLTGRDVIALAEARGLTHVTLGCCDWNGRLRAKQYHVCGLPKALAEGTAITSAIFAPDTAERPIETGPFHNPANGYRDAWLKPDPATCRDDAFESDGRGLLLLGQLAGEFGAFCPRALLAQELARWEALDLAPYGAYELEYYLLQESVESLRTKVPSEIKVLPELTRMYSYVDQSVAREVFAGTRAAAERMAIPIETLHAEFTGLIEAGLMPARGLAIADRAMLFKALAKVVARRHGLLATFMARLSSAHDSAGGHLNLSLRARDDGQPAFHAASAADRVSATLRHFIGGLQRYTPELYLLYCPHLNSYKRFGADSLAPKTNTWGIDNKTCAYRVVNQTPALTRVELRVPGADINPFLCLTACLAAGRRGIELALAPTAPAGGNAWAAEAPCGPDFPVGFEPAIARWLASDLAREVFGGAFVAAFAQSRAWQIEQLHRTVTDWEIRQYGECV